MQVSCFIRAGYFLMCAGLRICDASIHFLNILLELQSNPITVAYTRVSCMFTQKQCSFMGSPSCQFFAPHAYKQYELGIIKITCAGYYSCTGYHYSDSKTCITWYRLRLFYYICCCFVIISIISVIINIIIFIKKFIKLMSYLTPQIPLQFLQQSKPTNKI